MRYVVGRKNWKNLFLENIKKNNLIFLSQVKDALRIYPQPKVKYDQNFSTSRHNKSLKKIKYIIDVKNIYLT